MINKLKQNWYWFFIGGFILFVIIVFAVLGEKSVIAVHDNLDLFIPQYQMLKDSGTFFGHNTIVGFLDGQGRDYLPSEFNLVTVMYMILPAFAAYISCYILKIIIAIIGSWLFARDVLKESYVNYKPLVFMCGFAYGILNLFPNFGIPFAAIPLLLFIMHRIVTKPHLLWYVALFAYPFLSYFSYLGIFFIGYICVYFVYKWIKSKKFPLRVLVSIVVLSLGYVVCEYRLFYVMLFSGVESIRDSMVRGSLSGSEIVKEMITGFTTGDMHTESVHAYFVMPVCLIYFVIQTIIYIKNKQAKKIFTDYFNGVMLFIVFNSVMFGAFNYEPLRHLVEVILPPLKGFEFARTEFSNPFLWYLAFFIVLKRLYDLLPKLKWATNLLAVIAVFVIVFSGTRYNDLYSTAYSQYYQLKNGKPSNSLTFGEFYSTDLFDQAKEDIGYCGQWSVAYGFYPAVLEYNGINTLDGYLGYYEQFYKEQFRQIIAPALERVPESKAYFDNWGARCYMYSGTNVSIVNAFRDYSYTDEDIYVNLDEFKKCGGRYIFSRLKLNNADEVGLELVNKYTDENSPYTLYVYCTKSRYLEKEHSGVDFEDRNFSYDLGVMDEISNEFGALIDKSNSTDSFESTITSDDIDYYLGLLDEYYSEMDKLEECYAILNIRYNQDINNESLNEQMNLVYGDYMDYADKRAILIRDLVNSPAKVVLEEKYPDFILSQYEEYEELTQEQKDLSLKLQDLQNEYYEASMKEYTFEYNGEEWDFDKMDERADELEYEDLVNIYYGIMGQSGEELGKIYKEIVDASVALAKEEDFDNYAEYAYAINFGRDYTPDDVKTLCKEIRKNKKQLTKVQRALKSISDKDPGWITTNDTETFETLLPYLSAIDKELPEAMEYMLENNLYDLSVSNTKPDTGYTTGLTYSGDAFIFDSPYQAAADLNTYVHEYGHYNNMFHSKEDPLWTVNNLDLSEIHSQGLELIYCHNYSDIYGESTGKYLEAYDIEYIFQAIYQAAIVSEFELYVYEHPDETPEDYSRKYAKIEKSYGQNPGTDVDYSWVYIPHVFTSPLYYISYATSALAALDIYDAYLENNEYGCEKYMEITALPSTSGFRNALQFVGLPDIFKKGVTTDIIKSTSKKIQELAQIINES